MHGLMFGGWLEITRIGIKPQIAVKRTAGAHRIASYLREHDWDIEVLDFLPAWTVEELKEYCRMRIRKDTIFIGISSVFPLMAAENHIIDFVVWFKKKYPNITVIAGSKMLITNHMIPADYHVAGYGELALIELLKKITGKPSNIVVENFEMMGKHYNFVNADSSHPSYPMDDLQVKYETRDYIEPQESLTLEFTRGCKFKCKFCYFNVIGYKGRTWRCMSNLHDELLRNYEHWGITDYTCADETANAESSVLQDAAAIINKMPFETNVKGYIRADLLASRPQDWEHMAAMGLWGHYYGIESFNHESAKVVGKGMKPEKIQQGILDAQDYFLKQLGKYKASISLIIGLPHETEESFDRGVSWVFDNMKSPSVSIFPLAIHHKLTDSNLRNTYSEFEETWEESGLFEEKTFEEIGATKEGLGKNVSEQVRNAIWDRIQHPINTLWSHDTMNVWDAYKIYARYEGDENFLLKQSPSMWYLHKYRNAGYTFEDLHKTFAEMGGVAVGEKEAKERIQRYKEKKLGIRNA